jgi:HlyD family secretion protein
MKTKTRVVATIALAVTVGFGARYLTGPESAVASPYRTGVVTIGTVESTVTATGQLSALQSVAVGTQVSGQVIQLYADYNDTVRKGQLLARIDPTLQEQSLRNAEASLERVRAALTQAEREYERSLLLYEQQIITQSEFDQAKYNVTVAQSNLASAEVSREQAAQNLSYTEVYSPIDGVVVERNVEPGQTVAASMSAPQLFLLATDLSKLEILASVDESDIAAITAGMPVRFSVSAYPNDVFKGAVRQVRLSSASQENVVNYKAVISVDNSDLRLVPGMTAEVDFIVEQVEDALLVPNAALRLRPTDEMIAQLTDPSMIAIARGRPVEGPRDGEGLIGEDRRAATGSVRNATADDEGAFVLGGGVGVASTPSIPGRLWYLKDGEPGVIEVLAGISDGTMTAITSKGLEPGMEVITGIAQAEGATPQATTTNPFQTGAQGRPAGGFGPPTGGF